jgi:hypothetical protein
MIALVVSILIGWLILKMLRPRAPIYIEPPPPQLVIHLHLIVPMKESAAEARREFAERALPE